MSTTYDRTDHSMTYECDNDGCCESSIFYGDFNECVREAKEEGWRAYKIEDEWFHECPWCQNKEQDPQEMFG